MFLYAALMVGGITLIVVALFILVLLGVLKGRTGKSYSYWEYDMAKVIKGVLMGLPVAFIAVTLGVTCIASADNNWLSRSNRPPDEVIKQEHTGSISITTQP